MKPNRTSGFSVLEAIIVLAVTGLALTLIFSVGSKSASQGFSLGRRALDVSDRSLAVESYRALIGGVVLPQPRSPDVPLDPAFAGSASTISALTSVSRPNICSVAGRVMISMMLTIQNAGTDLTCSAGGGPAKLMMRLKGPAAFSYSPDGVKWRDALNVNPPRIGSDDPATDVETSVRLGAPPIYVRLATTDGSEQILAASLPERPLVRPPPPGQAF